MPNKVFEKIRKRDGRIHKFNASKIENAIISAGKTTGEVDEKMAKRLTIKALRLAHQAIEEGEIPTVEEMQDIVEEVLLNSTYHKTAKEYILYRDQKERLKEMSSRFDVELINQYLDKKDWQVSENANMGFSLQGLNNYMSSELSKVYWLNKIYPKEIRNAHQKGDFHIHDLSAISVYCFTGDTKVSLVSGENVSFKDLVKKYSGKTFWVYSIDKNNRVVPGLARNPRVTRKNSEIIKVTLDNGRSIKCTPDHKFMLRNGEYKQAKDLVKNDSLMPLYLYGRGRGYRAVYNPETNEKHYVHRLFVEAGDGESVHHKNGIKHDNRPCNLEKLDDAVHRSMEIIKTMGTDIWKDKHKEVMIAFNKSGKKRQQVRELALSRPERDEHGHFVPMKNHKVKSVIFLKKKEDVYDLTVDKYHNFGLEAGVFVHNCVGWDLWDLLVEGFRGVPDKTESLPAKHFRTALGQLVNFFYTLQGEAAGAQAFSSLDTLLAPFIRYDNLTYKEVKQTMQEFIFNINVPTRVGFQCFDEATEILTPNGWKKHGEVNVGDTICTFNLEKQYIENLPVKNVFSREYEGKMFSLKNRITDQLISPKHRIVRKLFGSSEYALQEVEEVANLKSPFIVPVGSMGKVGSESYLCDQNVELAAWVISEGTFDKGERGSGRISIYQSKLSNPEKYKEIKDLCNDLNLKYTERTQFGLGKPCQVLRFNASSTEVILEILEGSIRAIPKSILESGAEMARLFIETYIKGDGHEGCKIVTTSELLKDQLQHLCVMAGYGSTVSTRYPEGISKKIQYVIRIIAHPDTYIPGIKEVSYKGVIWCPNTDNETVVARRNGKVFITGNTPFTNVTLDLTPSPVYKDQNVIMGGKPQAETYKEFQKEMDIFNKAFFEVMLEGDAKGRVFTFPIPTYNITKDFDWDNRNIDLLWQITAKYGIPYFSNFINSDMKPEDSRSMCCRLRLNTKELSLRGGGLFGANPLTGSIGVVTINMPKLAFNASNGVDFMRNLGKIMDLAKESLEIKRDVLERFTEDNLYPYAKFYLRGIKKKFHKYWKNHFSTIGLIGMNEACLMLLKEDIGSKKGKKFAAQVLDFMRERLLKYQEKTGNNYNLEATPAEGTSYRLAIGDKSSDKNIICANEEAFKNGANPYYTNSTQLPVGYTDDFFTALDLQDELQCKYTGGTVVHMFMGEKIDDPEIVKKLVRKICENYKLPYFTITPTFSICPRHGYLSGEHKYCPKCDEEIIKENESKKEDKK